MTGWQLNVAGADASKLSNMPLFYYSIILSLFFHFPTTIILLAAQDRLTQRSDYILYYSFRLRLSQKAFNLAGGATQRWPPCDLLV